MPWGMPLIWKKIITSFRFYQCGCVIFFTGPLGSVGDQGRDIGDCHSDNHSEADQAMRKLILGTCKVRGRRRTMGIKSWL